MALLALVVAWLQRQTRGTRPPVFAKSKFRFRPRLDALEDRLAPATFYVDPTGLDTNPGTAALPYQNIQKGANSAYRPGDMVIVNSGTYYEQVGLNNNGTAVAPIVITAAPGATVIVDGQFTRNSGFTISAQNYVTLRDFTVKNTLSYGIKVDLSSQIIIDGNDVSYAGQPVNGQIAAGIFVNNTTNSTISKNTTHHNSDAGIRLTGSSSGVVIDGNHSFLNASVYQRFACGIDVKGSSVTNNIIKNNICHDNEDSGIQFYAGVTNNWAINNVVYDNGDHGIDSYNSTGQIFIGNTVFNNVTAGINVEAQPGVSSYATVTNNISVNNGINIGYVTGRSVTNIRFDSRSTVGSMMDYNLVYHSVPGYKQFQWGSTSYDSLAALRAANPSLEVHGLEADPLWADPAWINRTPGQLFPLYRSTEPEQSDGPPIPNYVPYLWYFQLLAGSPAIDAADASAPGQLATDVEGKPRVDVPATANTGAGPRLYDDRGAYEFQPGVISGKVFKDSNGNVALDAAEPGLAGWTVFLDANNNGTLDAGETSTTTDGTGAYTFSNLVAGTYRVRELAPAGWAQLTSNPPDIILSSSNWQLVANFGNFQVKFYVDQNHPNASDSGKGSANQPFRTIQAAANKADTGDGVLVAAGVYAEQVTVKKSGKANDPIVFAARTGASVTVTGATNGFTIVGRKFITVHGFNITGTTSNGIYAAISANLTLDGNNISYAGLPIQGKVAKGIYLISTTTSKISGNITHHNSDSGIFLTTGSTGVTMVGNTSYSNASVFQQLANGIDVRSGSNTIAGNITYDNEVSGIYVRSASNSLVVNNVSYYNGGHGINVYSSSSARIIANTVANNLTGGINLQVGSGGATVANNISVDNGVNYPQGRGNIAVDASSTSGTTLDYDLVFQHTAGQVLFVWGNIGYTSLAAFVAATGKETHGLQADPLWVSAATGNFHLLAGSPAIDSANSAASGQSATDADGRSRYDDPATVNTGAGPRSFDDRGAFEF